jgi:anti-sigma regulatory factor (Ser/Thr protein kinase)
MPYYRCPECGLTVHSVGGWFTRSTCPNCSATLVSSDRIQIEEHHPAAITREFPLERGAAGSARREIETLQWNLETGEFETLSLLVTELIANSVKHSGTTVGAGVRLDVALGEDVVRVEVRDKGPGFVPKARTEDSPLESNWGLHLMAEMADRWRVESDPETVVWVELDRVPVGARVRHATGRSSSEYGMEDRVRTPSSSTA